MDVVLCQILQSSDVIGNVLVPLFGSDFDIIGYVHGLDGGDFQPRILYRLLQLGNLLISPQLSRLLSEQGGNHPVYSRNLPNLLQGYAVITRSIPTQCHLHSNVLHFIL